MSGRSAIVVGLGNPLAGDDAAGLEVARRVRERAPADVRVVELEGDPSRLIDAFEGVELAVIVDAVSTQEVGRVHRIDASTERLPADLGHRSTHALGLADALEVARALDRLPRRVVVYGIAGAQFGAGAAPSPAVSAVISQVADRIIRELG